MTLQELVSQTIMWFPKISILLMIIIWMFDKEQLKPKLAPISHFVGLMVVVMFLRMSLFMESLLSSNLSAVNFSSFLTAPLEDVFFVMIPIYFSKFVSDRKLLTIPVWIIFSLLFAAGHLYQGIFTAMITGLYPYFISRKYILRHNLATVMVCHYLYDCMTLFTIKIAKLMPLVGVIL
jgi:hypothetical protein